MMNLLDTRKKVNSLLGKLNTVESQVESERKNLKDSEQHLANVGSAQIIVQQVSQQIQQQAHDRIAGVVDRCLKTVFADDYGFTIRFERKRGRTEAELILLKGENEINDPLNADSGGVVDVAAFALRLSCLILAKPNLRRLMVLDEPFKFVSAEYLDNVRQLLEGLAEDFQVQFVMVTHLETLATGRIVKL